MDELNILETWALLSIVDIFITPDGWPMHLAFAAWCKKVIWLFGPTNPDCVFINRKGYVVLYDRWFMPKVNKYFLPLTNRTISIKLSDVLKSI